MKNPRLSRGVTILCPQDITSLRAKRVLRLTACCQHRCPIVDIKRGFDFVKNDVMLRINDVSLQENDVASPMKCAFGWVKLPFRYTDSELVMLTKIKLNDNIKLT